jgi:hypothetical protein
MAENRQFQITWLDSGSEPQCLPDPAFPKGKDVDMSSWHRKGWPMCKVDLPYPAKRCGLYLVTCSACGTQVAVTTAGRPDDPRSVKFACKRTPAKELH